MTEESYASDPCCEVIITADNGDWLASFARTLVEERVVACAHVISEIRAVYRWDGALQDDAQARIALHTRSSLVPAIVTRADIEHPDLVPCVITVPISAGHPAYLRWIHEETMEPDNGPTR